MEDLTTRLRKKYDTKKLADVESDVLHLKKTTFSAQKGMIETLHYLETTERFKEDKAYENSSFDVYLKDKFSMLPVTYQNMRIEFFNFREESLKYGPGLVTSVKKKCGAEKMTEVFKEIKAADKTPKKPITRERIQQVIEKHKKVRAVPSDPVVKKNAIDWQSKYESEHKLRLEAERSIIKAYEQIDRLKETVLRLNSYQAAIQDAAMKFQEKAVIVS